MEPANTDINRPRPAHDCQRNGRIWTGLIIVIFGVLLLAYRAGAEIPHWVFSFEMLLIGIGILIGIGHRFRGFGWLIPVAIGSFLLIDDFYPSLNIGHYTWPLLVIGVGLFILLRPGKKKSERFGPQRHDIVQETNEDLLESVVVFGGIKKNIITKNFLGGESVTVFGGTELDFSQSEINKTVELELTQIFGGTKLILPAHWKVQTGELVAVFGGIDDKRKNLHAPTDVDEKVLVLKGTCILGGIEIRSYGG